MPAWLFWLLSAILALAGAALLYVSLLHDRPRGRRRCPKCWYDLAGLTGLTCPECGRTARKERSLHRTRRRWWRATTAFLILILAYAAAVTPRVLRTGQWWAALPRPVLVLVLQFYDDDELNLLRYACSLDAQNTPELAAFPYIAMLDRANAPAGAPIRVTAIERLLLARRCGAILDNTGPDRVPATSRIVFGLGTPTAPGLGSYERRELALIVLERLGNQSWLASGSLLRLLRKEPGHARLADLLATCATQSRRVVRELGQLGRTNESQPGDVALAALAKSGRSARAARDDLVHVLLAPSDAKRARHAAEAIVSIGPPDAALEILTTAMQVPKGRTRVGAVHGLGRMTSRRDQAIPMLTAAARDPVIRCPAESVKALQNLGAFPALIELVSESDTNLAAESAAALWFFGSKAAPAVPNLIFALSSTDTNLRNHAAIALGFIGPAAEPARPALEAMLSDPDPRLRTAASDALRLMSKPRQVGRLPGPADR